MKQTDIRKNLQKELEKEADEETVQISAIAEARNSAGSDQEWQDLNVSDESGVVDENDMPLGPAEARLYRGVAARFNYISPDRADIAYAVKETARSMSAPKESDMKKLRRLGKYLLGKPRLVMQFKWQDAISVITTFTDSDWAGDLKSAKSTSGGALCIGEHVTLHGYAPFCPWD